MKVLQMVPELNCGGVETGTIDMAKELLARGHQPYVMSAGGVLVDVLHKMGVVHFTVPIHKKRISTLFLIPQVAEIIRREKIDIVHARSRIPALIAYWATRMTDACFITTCHGYYSAHILSAVMGWGKRVIVISSAIGRHMIDTFHVPPERIDLVHRGLDIGKYVFNDNRYNEAKKQGKEKFIVANVARITPLKGHAAFLQAVRLAKRRFPNIEVWLIGSPGKKKKYFQEIQLLIEKLGISDSVRFFGARNDIPELLQKVDLLVLSTTVPEGFGRVLIEAGASGVPVIATRLGGVLDVIEDGKEGYLVSPDDPVEMSEAMARVFSDYTGCQERARTFRQKIEKQFTLQHMADKTVAVYQAAVQQKRILVIKLGALGDVILIVPSLRALRKRFPAAHITLVVEDVLAPLVEYCPYIDEIITYRRREKSRRLARFMALASTLREAYYDIAIDFQNNKWTHALAFFGDVRRRYGYARGLSGKMLSNGIALPQGSISPVQHQMRILHLLGISDMDERLELWATPEDEAAVTKMIAALWATPKKRLIGLVLNASSGWHTKRWPLPYFVALAQHLAEEYDAGIILIGDTAGKPFAEQFLLETETDAIDMVGKTTLRQLVALIKRLDCLVTGDTAPMHVASAVHTKTVALFGPTDPLRHVPPGTQTVVLKKNLSCGPCYKRTCLHTNCMKQLVVDDVMNAIAGLMQKEPIND